jgi:hypothetical protein
LNIEGAGHIFGGKNRVEIGINDFAANVLCDVHNRALSPLDAAAGVAFSTIEALTRDIARLADPAPALRSFHLSSGMDIERWLIKVYCGLVAAEKIRGLSGKVLERSSLPSYLFDALLGTSSLPGPLGLYQYTFVGQQRKLWAGFDIGTIQLTDGSDDVGGLLLNLGPINLILVTSTAFGQSFKEPNWHWHPTFLFNIKQGNCRIAYLLTY